MNHFSQQLNMSHISQCKPLGRERCGRNDARKRQNIDTDGTAALQNAGADLYRGAGGDGIVYNHNLLVFDKYVLEPPRPGRRRPRCVCAARAKVPPGSKYAAPASAQSNRWAGPFAV